MDYISVKETSKKFHLSERRIQKLCETNRIEGCKMVSGIWLIPASATKPSDERMTNFPKDSDYPFRPQPGATGSSLANLFLNIRIKESLILQNNIPKS